MRTAERILVRVNIKLNRTFLDFEIRYLGSNYYNNSIFIRSVKENHSLLKRILHNYIVESGSMLNLCIR
jgi:hypothetical protein